jgi:hypothetical protein
MIFPSRIIRQTWWMDIDETRENTFKVIRQLTVDEIVKLIDIYGNSIKDKVFSKEILYLLDK